LRAAVRGGEGGVTAWPAPADTLPPLDANAVAYLAHDALLREVWTYPKPGLVSHRDQGSHPDMDAALFRRSADALHPFLAALAEAGRDGAGMDELRRIGLAAEAAMLRTTGGINTHRGAIFGLGLLCAAAGRGEPGPLGGIVAARWGAAILLAPPPAGSHGTLALRRHGAGGARTEAAAGFPSVHRIGVPALRAGRVLAPDDGEAVRVQALFALMAAVVDTNLLHRGGAAGAAFVRTEAAAFLAAGGVGAADWRARAEALHRACVVRRLSPGGCADLLAMSLFVDAVDQAPGSRPAMNAP
jgi:triphosphoribosyl-dephospho-CoA synthase